MPGVDVAVWHAFCICCMKDIGGTKQSETIDLHLQVQMLRSNPAAMLLLEEIDAELAQVQCLPFTPFSTCVD